MNLNPLYAIDFYKADHRRQYPEGTTEIYSNFTPRYVKPCVNLLDSYDNQVVVFGIQYMLEELQYTWQTEFFNEDKDYICSQYQTLMCKALNLDDFDVIHIAALHDLGYLPVKIKAIAEGLRVPIGVPILTIVNTHPDFYWLTNYLETYISAELWKPITVATLAFEYRKLLMHYSELTGVPSSFSQYQGHDFSFRGMSGSQDAAICGAAHLTSFIGTDCVPAIQLLDDYYDGYDSCLEIGSSVPATEHSVICANGAENEFQTIKRLITEVYPNGIISIVADTYDFWQVLRDFLPSLYKEINERNGKVVIRPDSGNPFDIICGDSNANDATPAYIGALQMLWDTFGGRVNAAGYKELNSHIGLIYGDAITVSVAEKILARMLEMGFASSNIIFGVGSFSYQYITRDTLGFAMKATSIVCNGERKTIHKSPKTGDGKKTSAKGLLKVDLDPETFRLILTEDVTESEEAEGELLTVFNDGLLQNQTNLARIRTFIDIELAIASM